MTAHTHTHVVALCGKPLVHYYEVKPALPQITRPSRVTANLEVASLKSYAAIIARGVAIDILELNSSTQVI